MAEKENLDGCDNDALTQRMLEFVKQSGKSVSYKDFTTTRFQGKSWTWKEQALRDIGRDGQKPNITDWEVAWEKVRDCEGIIPTGHFEKRSKYRYGKVRSTSRGKELKIVMDVTPAQGPSGIQLDKAKPVSTKEVADHLIAHIVDNGDIKTAKARQLLENKFNVKFGRTWGQVMRSAKAYGRGDLAVIERKGTLYLKGNDPETMRDRALEKATKTGPTGIGHIDISGEDIRLSGQVTVRGLTRGQKIELKEGEYQIEADGGRISIRVTKATITFLGILAAIGILISF